MIDPEGATPPLQVGVGETHPTYDTDEVIPRLFDGLSSRLGVAIGATSLYEAVYEREYDSADPLASRSRMYLQLMLNRRHSFSKRFLEYCKEQDMSVQIGTMYVFKDDVGDDADIYQAYMQVPRLSSVLNNTRPRRVYRMFRAEDYHPLLHVGKEMGEKKYMIEWEPAIGPEVEYLPTMKSVIAEKQKGRKRGHVRPDHQATSSTQPPAESDKAETQRAEESAWQKSFVQAVRDAIAVKDEQGLMVEGEIPAKSVRILTTSRNIGTETNRKRLHSAGLLPRTKLNISTSLNAVDLIFAELFNAKRNILGQKTPKQKTAIEIVRQEVASYFESIEAEE